MKNLLQETLTKLENNRKTPNDILWIGSQQYGYFTWEDFKRIANTEYDAGYGAAEVAKDLVIAGIDFWLERGEYDGAEWWEYKTMPQKPLQYKKPEALTVIQAKIFGLLDTCGWASLSEINGEKND